MNQNKLHRVGNTIGLIIICAILTIAFVAQLNKHDLPCPLCLLQRLCFIAVGLCLCMNLKDGIKTSHYGLMTLSAVLGFSIALRQISLHLAPNDTGYGQLLLGFYMYVWSAIAFAIITALIGISMLFEQGFTEKQQELGRKTLGLMIFFLILILANGISTFVECGALVCPDNPIRYKLLSATNSLK